MGYTSCPLFAQSEGGITLWENTSSSQRQYDTIKELMPNYDEVVGESIMGICLDGYIYVSASGFYEPLYGSSAPHLLSQRDPFPFRCLLKLQRQESQACVLCSCLKQQVLKRKAY